MERTRVNMAVGIFLVLGILALGYLSIKLGRVSLFGGGGYLVSADFPSSAGLKIGANVEIAGVPVGRVESISLKNDQAHLVLRMQPQVKISEDAIVAIKTKGLLGEKYLNISPGGSDRMVPPNGRLTEVQPPVDLEELISKYVFGKV
jgi:phospholipid/cholesterol/gamma-HCH transport system substrate-binding protein